MDRYDQPPARDGHGRPRAASGDPAGRTLRAASAPARDRREPVRGERRQAPAPAGRPRATETHGRVRAVGTGATPASAPRANASRQRRGSGPTGGTATATAQAPARPKSRYIPALDGLRTFAVVAVVLYHLHLTWAQGGLLGVTMFFVLSGYLITRLLLNEIAKTGRIDLKGFWIRRIRRLVPAVVTVVVATAVLCTVFNHVMLTKMRPDILPSLLFFNNWWQILRNVSYFNALGDPSPLTHFWSLAIEEQFYLVWPPILFGLVAAGTSKPCARRVALGLAAASALAMTLLYNPGADPSRVYYGTDTRAFSLLLGAWMAFIPDRDLAPARLVRRLHLDRLVRALPFVPHRDRSDSRDGKPARPGALVQFLASPASIDLLGIIGLVGLVAMVGLTNGYTAFQYRGGTLLCSVLTLMVIAACVQPHGIVARAFSAAPLVWVGKRSYSIYLWHYPLLLLMNPVANIAEVPWWQHVLQIAVVVACAECSYRFIETPFRRGAFGRFWNQLRSGETTPVLWARQHLAIVVPAALVLIFAVGGIALVPDTSALSGEGAQVLNDTSKKSAKPEKQQAADKTDADNDGFPDGAYDLLMIGDSVSLRAVDSFDGVFPHSHIDAAKGRQFTEGQQTFESYLQQNLAGKIVVFALGTNGLVTDDQIDSLMNDVGDKRIAVFITTRSPQPWVGSTNDAINNAAKRYKNVRVIDWYSYSANRNDLFDGDGTHLSTTGVTEYLNLIYKTVKKDLPVHPEDHASDPQPQAVENAATSLIKALAYQPHKLGGESEDA